MKGLRFPLRRLRPDPLQVVFDSGDLLGEPGVPELDRPPVGPEESDRQRDDGRGRQHRVQPRCDLEPRESLRVRSERGRMERSAATLAEDEAGISTNEKMARDDQADGECQDGIDEAKGAGGASPSELQRAWQLLGQDALPLQRWILYGGRQN
jgi:hypothetical protein